MAEHNINGCLADINCIGIVENVDTRKIVVGVENEAVLNTLKINDNTLEISVDLPGGEEVNDEIKWDPTTLQFTFSLKAKKKEIIPVNGTPLVEKIEKGVYELNLKLQYLNYPIINMIPQKENQNGRHTFKFELLVTGYEKY